MGLVWSSCLIAPSLRIIPSPCAAPPSVAAPPDLRYYYSGRIAEMIKKLKSNPEMDKVQLEVQASKAAGWTEVSPSWTEPSRSSLVGKKEVAADNLRVFRRLQAQWPYGFFTRWTERDLELGKKIGEGSQAEVFELWNFNHRRLWTRKRWVIKIFKQGLRLRDLERLLPLGILAHRGKFDVGRHCNVIEGAMLFRGRFAIVMERKWGDLRKLIDARMIHNNMGGSPFTFWETLNCMRAIAEGMSMLHLRGISHGDLKAANVLVELDRIDQCPTCVVADYECSVGVVGTGFWRAPEILLALKNQNITPDLFSNAADVYSYGMTCYEIITGHLPFEMEGYKIHDFDRVIEGHRPHLPFETPRWLRELLQRCLHEDPSARPIFSDIINIISWHGTSFVDW